MSLIEEFKAKIDSVNPNKPLVPEESEYLIRLMMTDNPEMDVHVTSDDEEFKADMFWCLRVFLKRLEVLTTIKVTKKAAIMLAVVMDRPGIAVLYAYYIHRKLGKDAVLDLDAFSRRLFPMGLFSEEQNKEIWDFQKISKEQKQKLGLTGGTDNLIDAEIMWDL